MESLQKLENTLDEVFDKKAPYQLPPNSRKALASAMWWLALIFGVAQLWAAWSFWHLGHVVNRFVDYANSLSVTYGTGETVQHLGVFYYLSLLTLAADGLLMLLAVSQLKAFKKRRGWNYLYYSLLLNLVYGLIRVFSEAGGGITSLIGALIGSAVGAYFLFQIRSYFNGAHPVAKATVAKPAAPEKPAAAAPAKPSKK